MVESSEWWRAVRSGEQCVVEYIIERQFTLQVREFAFLECCERVVLVGEPRNTLSLK